MYDPNLFSSNPVVTAVLDVPCAPCQLTLPVTRQTAKAGTCISYGDPHFQCLNGAALDFMGTGVFYLLNSPHLIVQSYQYLCNGAYSCVGGVAIR